MESCDVSSFIASSQLISWNCAGAALARTLQRASQTIGMIDHLKASLAARAELAAIDGMKGIAFELFGKSHLDDAELALAHDFGFTLHHADEQAAARRDTACRCSASRWQCPEPASLPERNG